MDTSSVQPSTPSAAEPSSPKPSFLPPTTPEPPSPRPSSIRAQLMTSWASIVIAICALLLSVYSARETQENTRFATMPYLSFSFDWTGPGVGWSYSNDGQGPALIKSYEVLVDGRRMHTLDEFVAALDIPAPWQGTVDLRVLYPGRLIPPHEAFHHLIWFNTPDKNGTLQKKLASTQDRISFRACYCSLFGDCWRSSTAAPEAVASCEVLPLSEVFAAGSSPDISLPAR